MPNFVAETTRGQDLIQLFGEYVTEDLVGHLASLTVGLLMAVGAILMLLAAVGLMRLPDLPTRMHASTKAGSLGAAMIMLAVAIHLPSAEIIARALAVVVFLLLTAPVAAHVIGRAGYFVGVPLWSGTVKDELADQYDYEAHTLGSGVYADRVIDMGDDDDSGRDGDGGQGPEAADQPESEAQNLAEESEPDDGEALDSDGDSDSDDDGDSDDGDVAEFAEKSEPGDGEDLESDGDSESDDDGESDDGDEAPDLEADSRGDEAGESLGLDDSSEGGDDGGESKKKVDETTVAEGAE